MLREKLYSSEMAGELRELMRHANALLDATADQVDDRIKDARARLEQRLADAKRKYADIDDVFREKLQATGQLIQDKPYQAIGGSFVVGLLLGWLMSRK